MKVDVNELIKQYESKLKSIGDNDKQLKIAIEKKLELLKKSIVKK